MKASHVTSAESGLRRRLRQRRPALLAVAALCAVFAWLEPERAVYALAGFALACVYLLVLRADAAAPGDRNAVRERLHIWPDNSLKSFADALTYPVYLLDSNAVLRYANRNAVEAFGPATVGDPIGYKFRHPDISRAISAAVSSGSSTSIEYQDHVPQQRWFSMHITPIPNMASPGRTEFHLLTFVDFSEMKRSEQMRSDFIANASHELRTPLASLRGFIETIRGPAATDRKAVNQFLEVMLEQAERMSRLIDDLLSLSRIEMKAHLRPQSNVDLSSVLGHVCDSLAPLAEAQEVELERDFPSSDLLVKGDQDELVQVFDNLVENACKYGRSGGRVEVSARRLPRTHSDGPASIEARIRDYGPGIPAEHLPRLTERFYRVDIETSREKQGTGLGLAIVKHILMRHGTRLHVSSEVGKGAEFSVIFDAMPAIDNVEEKPKSEV